MTQPDLSSLALPDSPELPADITDAIREMLGYAVEHSAHEINTSVDECPGCQRQIASLRSVIAQHLLTANEARWLLEWASYYRFENETLFGKNDTALKKLRLLSGSIRGEE